MGLGAGRGSATAPEHPPPLAAPTLGSAFFSTLLSQGLPETSLISPKGCWFYEGLFFKMQSKSVAYKCRAGRVGAAGDSWWHKSGGLHHAHR